MDWGVWECGSVIIALHWLKGVWLVALIMKCTDSANGRTGTMKNENQVAEEMRRQVFGNLIEWPNAFQR